MHSEQQFISHQLDGRPFLLHPSLLTAPYPQSLSFEATNFCNLACTHCGHSQFPPFSKGHLDMKYFYKVKHLLGTHIRSVSLSNFGEPLISRVWPELLNEALTISGLNISFITNGLLLDKHLDRIIDPRVTVAVSIDGASEETFGAFRGKNSFHRLCANLERLSDLKQEKGIPYPAVVFYFTVSRINCHELTEIVDMAKRFGAGGVIVQFQLFFDQSRFERESLFFAQKDYNNHIASASRRAHETGILLLHPDSFDHKTFVPRDTVENSWLGKNEKGAIQCFAQLATSHIRYDGIVEACCGTERIVMGSLESDTFEDIWYGPDYRGFRLTFDRGIWPERCGNCNLIQTVDVHDRKSHFVSLPDAPASGSAPQRYRITDIDRVYQEALSYLPKNHEKASAVISGLANTDENLYEIGNLKAYLYGFGGDRNSMHETLLRCRRTAPEDRVISQNLSIAEGS